jgi:signal transduction histidine kinase
MNVLVRSKVGRRFLGVFLLLSLPMVAAGWFGIKTATETLSEQTHWVLRASCDGAEAQLREFLLCLRRTTEALETDAQVRACLRSADQGTADIKSIFGRIQERIPEAVEIFCLDRQGRVVASSAQGPIKTNEFSRIFAKGREEYWPGDVIRDAVTGKILWRMSAPIKEPGNNVVVGVVVLGVDPAALTSLTTGRRVQQEGADTESFRIGGTGETYIVNRDGFMITESRFIPDAILRLKVQTEPVRAALNGQEIMGDYSDYRGVAVSGASAILRDLGWVMITEIDFRQAFAPIRRLRNLLIGIAIAVGLAAGLIARGFARGIIDPLRLVDAADRALAKGDEDSAIVPEERLPQDEIGEFIRKRNFRIKELIGRQRELAEEQEARAEASAELEGLAYSMVHDMRAPLRAVISLGDLLQEQAQARLRETERGFLDRMKGASLRMDQLICDMLRYSSLLRAEVRLTTVRVPDLLRRMIQENSTFGAHGADIQIDNSIPPVSGNVALLTQCFGAILDNAIRYTRPGVHLKITIRGERKGDWVRVSVRDNGMGMPKEFQNRVFGLFQKGTNSPQGSGLGLALVRVSVRRMGGRVGVESEEGVGSCFWIELKPSESPEPASSS